MDIRCYCITSFRERSNMVLVKWGIVVFFSKWKFLKKCVYGCQDDNIWIVLDCIMWTLLNERLPLKEASRMVQGSIILKSPPKSESSETAAISLGRSSLLNMAKAKCHIDQWFQPCFALLHALSCFCLLMKINSIPGPQTWLATNPKRGWSHKSHNFP